MPVRLSLQPEDNVQLVNTGCPKSAVDFRTAAGAGPESRNARRCASGVHSLDVIAGLSQAATGSAGHRSISALMRLGGCSSLEPSRPVYTAACTRGLRADISTSLRRSSSRDMRPLASTRINRAGWLPRDPKKPKSLVTARLPSRWGLSSEKSKGRPARCEQAGLSEAVLETALRPPQPARRTRVVLRPDHHPTVSSPTHTHLPVAASADARNPARAARRHATGRFCLSRHARTPFATKLPVSGPNKHYPRVSRNVNG
jgi:hypothetical protein